MCIRLYIFDSKFGTKAPEMLDEYDIGTVNGRFDEDLSWCYGITLRDTGVVIGGSGIHMGLSNGARAIGYWVRADHTRCGYATEVAAALTYGAIVEANSRRNSRSSAVKRCAASRRSM